MNRLKPAARRAWALLKRVLRAAIHLAKDETIPAYVRVLLGALAFIPIPGPFDELLILLIAATFYRRQFVRAWTLAGVTA